MDAREKLARILLERVRKEKYPSRTEMEIFEATAPREMLGEYVEVLLQKVARARRPSITMLRRIQQLLQS